MSGPDTIGQPAQIVPPHGMLVDEEPAERSGIASRAPENVDVEAEAAAAAWPAGVYRVIHGALCLPLPRSQWTLTIGGKEHEIPHAPRITHATVGDEVRLTAPDAATAGAAGLIESVAVPESESRAGKCWLHKPDPKKKVPARA